MFLLLLLPCADGGGGVVEWIGHTFEVEHQHGSDHTEHSKNCGDDTCPPFCVCTCCSSVVDIPTDHSLEIKTPDSLPETTPSFIPTLSAKAIDLAIWQPPRTA